MSSKAIEEIVKSPYPDGTPSQEECLGFRLNQISSGNEFELTGDLLDGPETALLRKEMRASLTQAFKLLQPRHAKVLTLWSQNEPRAKIAFKLGVSEKTVQQYIRKGLSKLRTPVVQGPTGLANYQNLSLR